MTDNEIMFAVSNYVRSAGEDVKGAIVVTSKDMIAINDLINRRDAEIEKLKGQVDAKIDGNFSLTIIKSAKADAIKDFAQELICEIENRPPSKVPDGAFYFSGRNDRQKEIIEIIKEKAGADV